MRVKMQASRRNPESAVATISESGWSARFAEKFAASVENAAKNMRPKIIIHPSILRVLRIIGKHVGCQFQYVDYKGDRNETPSVYSRSGVKTRAVARSARQIRPPLVKTR